MIGHLSTGRMVELAVAVLLLVAGIYFYRRPKTDKSDTYGSQGAVIMFVIALIMGTHALGGFDYRPSQSEIEIMKARAR